VSLCCVNLGGPAEDAGVQEYQRGVLSNLRWYRQTSSLVDIVCRLAQDRHCSFVHHAILQSL